MAALDRIALKYMNLVTEITLDMAANMGLIAKKCFPNAIRAKDCSCLLILIFFLKIKIKKTPLFIMEFFVGDEGFEPPTPSV